MHSVCSLWLKLNFPLDWWFGVVLNNPSTRTRGSKPPPIQTEFQKTHAHLAAQCALRCFGSELRSKARIASAQRNGRTATGRCHQTTSTCPTGTHRTYHIWSTLKYKKMEPAKVAFSASFCFKYHRKWPKRALSFLFHAIGFSTYPVKLFTNQTRTPHGSKDLRLTCLSRHLEEIAKKTILVMHSFVLLQLFDFWV